MSITLKQTGLALLVAAFLVMPVWAAEEAAPAEEKASEPYVLIICASGIGTAADAEANPALADAISMATPKTENMKTLCEKLAAALGEKKIAVRMAAAEEATDVQEVLDAKVLVLASPAYFGNVSWQMKKFIDQVLWVVYRTVEGRLGGKTVALMSMGGGDSSAQATIDIMKRAVGGSRGTEGPEATFSRRTPAEEVTTKINELAERIAAACK